MHEKQLQNKADGLESEQDKISALTRLERLSELVWKDRQFKTNDKIRLDNLLVGHNGTYAFDTDI